MTSTASTSRTLASTTTGKIQSSAYDWTPINHIEQASITNGQTIDELCKTVNILADRVNQLTDKLNSILTYNHPVNNYSSYSLRKYNDQYDSD